MDEVYAICHVQTATGSPPITPLPEKSESSRGPCKLAPRFHPSRRPVTDSHPHLGKEPFVKSYDI